MALGTESDNLAPAYLLKVSGAELDIGITGLVTEVEYESADGVADVLKVRVANQDAVVSDSKIFQIGNEVEVWMGYGTNLTFIGAAVIAKTLASFPEEGIPMLEVVGYSRDHQMMDNEPPEVKTKKKKKKKGKGGRVFRDAKFSDAVRQRGEDYLFQLDVDDTPETPHDFVQAAGMNDYEFVRGMANLTGYVFWVDRNPAGTWILHFKDPKTINLLQTTKYVLEYGTELASLLSFEPEMVFTGSYTKLVAHVKNARTGKLLKAEVEDGAVSDDALYNGNPDEKIKEPPPSGGSVKLYFEDWSIEVQSGQKFKTEEELTLWAASWFERNRDNFVIARGKTIGIESLRAREVHEIAGVGTLYSGDYQLDRVRHVCTESSGYHCDWHGRKVLPPPK